MNVYRSPIYPALMVRLPGDGRRSIKASGGYFNVDAEDVDAFEAFIASRPHYRITLSASGGDEQPTGAAAPDGSEHGAIVTPEPMSESERHPETVKVDSLENLTVPQLQERLAAHDLPTEGRKAVLVKRLADATGTPTGLGDDAALDPDAE